MRTNDPLKQFVFLRDNLVAEKARLAARLKEINAALGITPGDSSSRPSASGSLGARAMSASARAKIAAAQRKRWALRKLGSQPAKSAKAGAAATGGRITLREAVAMLLKQEPLSKKDIVARLKSTGFQTTSKNVSNLLNPVLYGKRGGFKNLNGKFVAK